MSINSFKVSNSIVFKPIAQPSSPENGEIYFDSTSGTLKKYESGSWSDVGSGGGGPTNISKYTAVSTTNQTVINLTFSVDVVNTLNSFFLVVDGKTLTYGASNDFIFTSITGDFSSQVTLNFPIDADLNIQAYSLAGESTQTFVNSLVKNYIQGGDAESGTSLFATYADAASSRPVDGTGGTATTLSFSTSTSSPLSGNTSFLLAKSANNGQGQGLSYAFTVDSADKARVLKIDMDYIVDSGTFVAGSPGTDSDLIVYLYDVTNAVLIEPSSFRLLSNSSTIADRFSASFQTASNSTSYRLIFHVATTSAVAWTLKLDNICVSPSNYTYGTPITDWQDYILTIGATTTPPTQGSGATKNARWRRVGDSMEITFNYYQTAAGSSGSGTYLFPIPSGFTIDSTKIALTTLANGNNGTVLGNSIVSDIASGASSFSLHGQIFGYSTTQLYIVSSNSAAGQSVIMSSSSQVQLGDIICNISFKATVPILGWSSSVQMSDSADTRVVSFSSTKSANQAVTADITNFTFTSVSDSHGAWNGTDTYIVPVAGTYSIGLRGFTTASGGNAYIWVNGVKTSYIANLYNAQVLNGTSFLNLKSGDLITIRIDATLTISGNATGATSLIIQKLSGPTAIAATETIAASYYCSANFAASTTIPINFDAKEYDTHGAVVPSATIWRFIAPAAGLYNVGGFFAAISGTANMRLYKNGSIYKEIAYAAGTANTSANSDIKLLAGDYIEVRPGAAATMAGGALNASNTVHICIKRVGL